MGMDVHKLGYGGGSIRWVIQMPNWFFEAYTKGAHQAKLLEPLFALFSEVKSWAATPWMHVFVGS